MMRRLLLSSASAACLGQDTFLNPNSNYQGQNSNNYNNNGMSIQYSQGNQGNYNNGNYNNGNYNNGNSNNGNSWGSDPTGNTNQGQPYDGVQGGQALQGSDPYAVGSEFMHCPMMTELGTNTKLQVVPWAWLRTVNIVQLKNGAVEPSGGGGSVWDPSGGPGLSTAASNIGSGPPSYLPDSAIYHTLGQVRTKISFSPDMGIYDAESDREITYISNPLAFWDTQQEISDCNGKLLGMIRHRYNWINMFTNEYVKHEVFNAQGLQVANLYQESFTQSFFASGQHFIKLVDLSGNVIASMRNPTGGWQVGPFGEYFECDIMMGNTMGSQVPPPAMNPDFLGLVFANAMAGEHRLGPYCSLIVWPVLIVLICCCGGALVRCFLEPVISCLNCLTCGLLDNILGCLNCLTCGLLNCLFCGACVKEPEAPPKKEETEILIAQKGSSIQQAPAAQRSGWNCCSRRQVAPN